MKLCTTCGDEYDESVDICPRDGTPLFSGEESEAVDLSEPSVEPEPAPPPVVAATPEPVDDFEDVPRMVGEPDASDSDPTALMEIGDREEFKRRALEAAGIDVDEAPPRAPDDVPRFAAGTAENAPDTEEMEPPLAPVEPAWQPPEEPEPVWEAAAPEQPPVQPVWDAHPAEHDWQTQESAPPTGMPTTQKPQWEPPPNLQQEPQKPLGPQQFRPPPAQAAQQAQQAQQAPPRHQSPNGAPAAHHPMSMDTGEVAADLPKSSSAPLLIVVVVVLAIAAVGGAWFLGLIPGGDEPTSASVNEPPPPDEPAVVATPDVGAVPSSAAGADAGRAEELAVPDEPAGAPEEAPEQTEAEEAPPKQRKPQPRPRKPRKQKQKPAAEGDKSLEVWGDDSKEEKGGNPDDLLPIN